MLCKYSLRDIFTQSFGVDQANQVSGFFQYVLQVWDATWEDMIEELQSMRRNSCEDFDRVTMLYERIAAGAVGNEETQRHVRWVLLWLKCLRIQVADRSQRCIR